MMLSHDLNEFLSLSAMLNYQLCAHDIDWNNILSIVMGEEDVRERDRVLYHEVFTYLDHVYGQNRRRLGPPSVLHPIRAAAVLARALERPVPLEIITTLLHDKFEDILPEDFAAADWTTLDGQFYSFLQKLPEADRWYLMERLQWLTKKPGETYYEYIGQMLDQARNTPEVIRVKLADRLDNTLDMRIDRQDPFRGVDFFESVFQMLFTTSYRGFKPIGLHPSSPTSLNGSKRLYQLFKNIVLMSLVRCSGAAKGDPASQKLFRTLALASMKESQRIALHIFGFHMTNIHEQRRLMLETMEYVQGGGIEAVTLPNVRHPLDGLFLSRFHDPDRRTREQRLAELYQDKDLMIQSALAFIVIFLSFLNDPDYFVQGVSPSGIAAGQAAAAAIPPEAAAPA